MSGRILIADEIPTNRIILRVKLASARYDVLQVALAMDLIPTAREQRPDVILLDDTMGDGAGIKLCRALKADKIAGSIPIILITERHESALRIAALDAGADEILVKPVNDLALLARVRAILRARESTKELDRRRRIAGDLGFSEAQGGFQRAARIAFIAPKDMGQEWQDALKGVIADRMDTVTEPEAIDMALSNTPPDLFVVAPRIHAEAQTILANLRSRPGTRRAAIIVVYPAHAEHLGAMALDMGANDLLLEGFEPAELAIRIKTQLRRKHLEDDLRSAVDDGLRMATTDPLTGLYNRRYAMARLADVDRDALVSNRSFAVILADLDHFKRVNDTYGHAAGDAVLVEVSRRLQDNLRGADLVARYGGEEFLMVLPETEMDRAAALARRLCRLISSKPFVLPGRKVNRISVTMSIGVAIGGPERAGKFAPAEPLDALIARADAALYGAKADGRNQVIVAAANAA